MSYSIVLCSVFMVLVTSGTLRYNSPPKGPHVHLVKLYFHEFLSQFYFLTPMDYSPWSEREIWPFLKVAVSPKPEMPHPPKSVYMHVTQHILA